jgi:hypothetical protein
MNQDEFDDEVGFRLDRATEDLNRVEEWCERLPDWQSEGTYRELYDALQEAQGKVSTVYRLLRDAAITKEQA